MMILLLIIIVTLLSGVGVAYLLRDKKVPVQEPVRKSTLEEEIYKSRMITSTVLNHLEEFNNRDNPEQRVKTLFEQRKNDIQTRADSAFRQ